MFKYWMGFLLLAMLAAVQAGEVSLSEGAAKGMREITIESTAFQAGGVIPKQYTGEGADVSPPLSWSGVPKETQELALICDDPDAPRTDPWVHWVLYALHPETQGLPENVLKKKILSEPREALQGVNDMGKIGYNGPMPPIGHGLHHYHFKLYALDRVLNVPLGATKDKLLTAMKGHVLAEGELIGTYERKR